MNGERSTSVTVKDVALAAGVSRSTASRVIAGAGYVAPLARQRVQEAIDALGYVPNASARSLRKQDSNTIGVMVSALRDPFYAELAAGTTAAARRLGKRVALFDCGGSSAEVEGAIEAFVELRVIGVLATPFDASFTQRMLERGIPVVEIDRVTGTAGVSAVIVDNHAGGRRATQQLIDAGHRRIAFVIDETDWMTGQGRLAGYKAAMIDAGLEECVDVISCGFSVYESQSAVRKRLSNGDPRPTAIFAANNVMAEGVWRAMREARLVAPHDVSFIAFDDAPWMTMVDPQVDCIKQPVFEMGDVAVSHLLALAQGAVSPCAITLETELITRQSISAPSQKDVIPQ